jgi:hypothetical protein
VGEIDNTAELFLPRSPSYRMIGALVAADIVGAPALSTGPPACTAGASGSARHVLPASMITLMALAKATAMILQWVRRSAPINEWDMSGSSFRADARPKDGRRNGVPTASIDLF